MNITLLGATGKTGTAVLEQALAAGHNVTALVRTPNKLTIEHEHLSVVQGDATNAEMLRQAMTGNQVLISTLGTTIGPKSNGSLITDSTHAIIEAAQQAGLKRIIMMSSFAVNQQQLSRPAQLITGAIMKKHIIDKTVGESELRGSGLDWTIVYPTTLTNGDAIGQARIVPATETVGIKHKISRSDVAAWLLHEAAANQHSNTNVTITS